MNRYLHVLCVLGLSGLVFAQTSGAAAGSQDQANPGQPVVEQSSQPPAAPVTPAGPGGLVNNQGYVTTITTSNDPMLVTPVVMLVTPSPTAGISSAGRAGISNQPGAAQFSAPTSDLEGVRIDQTGVGYSFPANPSGIGESQFVDSGAHGQFIVGTATSGPATGASLAEMAAQVKTNKSQNGAGVRLFTNEHIDRMNAGMQTGSFEAPTGAEGSTNIPGSTATPPGGMQHDSSGSTVNSDQDQATGERRGAAKDRKTDRKRSPFDRPKP